MTPIEASNIRVRIMGSKVAGGERNSNLRFEKRESGESRRDARSGAASERSTAGGG
jgi:hypothetical protein